MMFTRAIVCPPASNFSDGITTRNLGAPNLELARAQHQAYCQALVQCGLKLTNLEADPNYPDSTFVEDTAVLTKQCAVIARPGAPSRLGEVNSIRKVIRNFYSTTFSIEEPGILDGGDICEAGDHFFIGLSERTNESGAQQLANVLDRFGYSSSFVDIRKLDGLLHLKSGLAYLGDKCLAVTERLSNVQFHGYEIVPVNVNEEYAANCVRVNDHVLLADGYPKLGESLRDRGYKTISLNMSEFLKMDGGLSCLSLRF